MTDLQNVQQTAVSDNILTMKNYVGKHVEMKTAEGAVYAGWVYTIDPVTKSFVIVNPAQEENKLKLEFIMGHSICNVAVLEKGEIPTDCFAMLEQFTSDDTESDLTPAELLTKKEKVMQWFQRNLIPICTSPDDDTVLIVMKALQISPPYRACDCLGDNEIMLGKIQGILESMPMDVGEV